MKQIIRWSRKFAGLAALSCALLIATVSMSPASAQAGWRFLGVVYNHNKLQCTPPRRLLDFAPGKPRHVLYSVWGNGLVGLVDLYWDEPQVDPISGTVLIGLHAVTLRGKGWAGVRIGGAAIGNGQSGPIMGEAMLLEETQKSATIRWEPRQMGPWVHSFSIQIYIGDGSQCAENFIARYSWVRL